MSQLVDFTIAEATLLIGLAGQDEVLLQPVEAMQRQIHGDLYEHNNSNSFKYMAPKGHGVSVMLALGIEEFTMIDTKTAKVTRMRMAPSCLGYDPVEEDA